MTEEKVEVFAANGKTPEAIKQARMYIHTTEKRGIAPEESHKILRSYKLEDNLVSALDQYAAENRKDKSEVVAEALLQFLGIKDREKKRAEGIQRFREQQRELESKPCPLCHEPIDFNEQPPLTEIDNEDWEPNFVMSKKHGGFVHITCLHKIGESEYEQG